MNQFTALGTFADGIVDISKLHEVEPFVLTDAVTWEEIRDNIYGGPACFFAVLREFGADTKDAESAYQAWLMRTEKPNEPEA